MSNRKRIGGVAVLLLVGGCGGFLFYQAGLAKWLVLTSEWVVDNPGQFSHDTAEHILTGGIVAVGVMHFRLLCDLWRRYFTERTDEEIRGDWHVYRYGGKHHDSQWLHEVWRIELTMRNKHRVRGVRQLGDVSPLISGEVVYNEVHKLNILINGSNHRQQSMVAFVPTIETGSDSRMLGIGVGDDAGHVRAARIYFAARDPLPREYVEPIIQEATEHLKKGQNLLHLPDHIISRIFHAHPLPVANQMKSTENIVWFWRRAG